MRMHGDTLQPVMPRPRRLLAGLALAWLCACNDVACWWTDDPQPDPWRAHQPEQRYATADGAFEVVLHADGAWPPVVGTRSLRIAWVAADGSSPEAGAAMAERPFLRSGDWLADGDPVAVELEPALWRIEALLFDAPGQWVVPIVLEQGGVDDSIELHIDVIEGED